MPVTRAALHWPSACPTEDRLPKAIGTNVANSDVAVEFKAATVCPTNRGILEHTAVFHECFMSWS